jgi:hypothetical protein
MDYFGHVRRILSCRHVSRFHRPLEALPFLEKRLRPGPVPAAERVTQLVGDLDSDRYAVREKAARELEELETTVEAALRQALNTHPSPERRR